ncbi:MAG: hypothetical protein HY554_14820 [Elusimicrobia bacterium]|nr:hypothetical protein [Elusimicrobiota bacterium]
MIPALLLSGLLVAPLRAQAPVRGVPGAFECRIDASWTAKDLWGSRFPLYAFVRADGATISIERFPRGNALHPTPAAFEASLTAASLPPKERARRSEPMVVEGGARPTWARRFPRAPASSRGAPVWMTERIVLLASRADYLVLRYRAKDPRPEEFAAFLRTFRRLSETP